MYNIIQLNDKNLSELQVIAKELGIKKADSFKKEELVYKILDEQAIAGATKKVAAEKLKEERKGDKNKRSRTAAPKKEEKVAPAAKNAEVTKNKENAPAAKPQQQPKEEAANKAKEAPVAEPKAEKAAPKRKVGRPRKDANIAEKAQCGEKHIVLEDVMSEINSGDFRSNIMQAVGEMLRERDDIQSAEVINLNVHFQSRFEVKQSQHRN